MNNFPRTKNNEKKREFSMDSRFRVVYFFFLLWAFIIIFRLITLMIFQHGFYTALATGSHEVYANLFPKRGQIYIQDSRTGEEYPIAINRDYFLVYADTRQIEDEDQAEEVAEKLAEIFAYDDERKLEVFLQLEKEDDPYEPIEKKVDETVVDKLKELDLPGIGFIRKPFRYYPEVNLASQVVGFLGKNEDGDDVGRYGLEGYWQEELAGSGGFLEASKASVGGLIPLAGKKIKPAEDGADIVLTIDRTIQYKACEILQKATEEYKASSASVVVMDPNTGAIRAMCSIPDFDPNDYGNVDSIEVYNNSTIFTPYEPGSIFKPVGMAAAINEGILTPDSYFYDTGSWGGLCQKPIKNAGDKIYENQTMTGVLENSINTGMVYVADKLGRKKFVDYVERFGFGIKTGVGLDTEVPGNIDTLSISKGNKIDCYTATASFGQGITATPLQMASAFSTIANGGDLMQPYIVEKINYSDGRVEKHKPKKVATVLDKRSALLVSGMMVKVVDNGHALGAAVPGYYVAGKTGTAQIAGLGGYTNETNHSFVGFAPVDDPEFVMIVKFEKPQRVYSASTAAPVFGEIAKFILQYYQVPPSR